MNIRHFAQRTAQRIFSRQAWADALSQMGARLLGTETGRLHRLLGMQHFCIGLDQFKTWRLTSLDAQGDTRTNALHQTKVLPGSAYLGVTPQYLEIAQANAGQQVGLTSPQTCLAGLGASLGGTNTRTAYPGQVDGVGQRRTTRIARITTHSSRTRRPGQIIA